MWIYQDLVYKRFLQVITLIRRSIPSWLHNQVQIENMRM